MRTLERLGSVWFLLTSLFFNPGPVTHARVNVLVLGFEREGGSQPRYCHIQFPP